MPILTINDLALGGINSDISPWELDSKFITSGMNFRILNNKIASFGGYETWDTDTNDFFPGYMQYVPGNTDYWLLAGREGVYVFDGSTFHDISNVTAGSYTSIGTDQELNWTGCRLGRIPIINNPQHHPEFWSPQNTSTMMQDLPFVSGTSTWESLGYSCQVMRAHKNHLIAMNMNEGGTDYFDTLRWSHPADSNSLPFTWDETEPTNLAGRHALGGDSGSIIDGLSLRDAFAVYSESAINIMDSTHDSFVFRFREMSSTVGLLAKRCISEVKGTHFFLGDGDIIANDGNAIKSLIHKRLRRRLTANMSADYYDRSFSVINTAMKEVWFCVPEDGATHPNIAYIYNWRDDTWALRDLPNISHAAYGARSTPPNIWGGPPEEVPTPSGTGIQGTWAEQTGTWGTNARTPLDDFVMGVQADGSIVQLDGITVNEGSTASTIERSDFALEGHSKVTTIRTIYPHMEGTKPVEIRFGAQQFAGGPILWKPAVTFTPGVDRKVDIRSTGELHAWRVSSTEPGNWKFSGMDIDYVIDGER